MPRNSSSLLVATILVLAACPIAARAENSAPALTIAAAIEPKSDEKSKDEGAEKKKSPEEKMQARFPQPVRAGDLIGQPVLDGGDNTIGYVKQVVRTEDGKIQLIVPYGRWFGWVRYGGPFDWGRRAVPVPIELVASLGRQVAALDMDRAAFERAPAWVGSRTQLIPPDEKISIALTRR